MTESKPIETELTTEGRLTSLRASGWTVAVHNDYRLNGTAYTFWLFTRGNDCAKGEGLNDEQAISRAYDSVLWLDERRANAIESARAGFIPAATITSERAQWAKEREGLEALVAEERKRGDYWNGQCGRCSDDNCKLSALRNEAERKQSEAESRATSAERDLRRVLLAANDTGVSDQRIVASVLRIAREAVDALATPPAVKEPTEVQPRETRLTPHDQFNLDLACRPLVDAFGWGVFQVGSSLQRGNYRDVDVRCMLDDDEYAHLFSGKPARLRVLNAAVTLWLGRATGLPIDFQFQDTTAANAEFGGPRSALGVTPSKPHPAASDSEKAPKEIGITLKATPDGHCYLSDESNEGLYDRMREATRAFSQLLYWSGDEQPESATSLARRHGFPATPEAQRQERERGRYLDEIGAEEPGRMVPRWPDEGRECLECSRTDGTHRDTCPSVLNGDVAKERRERAAAAVPEATDGAYELHQEAKMRVLIEERNGLREERDTLARKVEERTSERKEARDLLYGANVKAAEAERLQRNAERERDTALAKLAEAEKKLTTVQELFDAVGEDLSASRLEAEGLKRDFESLRERAVRLEPNEGALYAIHELFFGPDAIADYDELPKALARVLASVETRERAAEERGWKRAQDASAASFRALVDDGRRNQFDEADCRTPFIPSPQPEPGGTAGEGETS